MSETRFNLIKGQADDEQSSKLLAQFILANPDLHFIEKSKTYYYDGEPIQFSQNLIRAKPETDNTQKFYVISNEEEDSLGKGADSRVRKIAASIEISKSGIKWQEETGLGVRVTNTQSAEYRRLQNNANNATKYDHQVAFQNFIRAQQFPHYGLQKPVEVKKQNKTLQGDQGDISNVDFTKSYSVVTLLPGKDFDDACNAYMKTPRTTKEVVDNIILPLLITFTQQIPKHLSHSDIKPTNVLMEVGDNEKGKQTSVNFLDFDFVQKTGEPGHAKGTPGYLPPEVFQENIPKVDASRDMFALGMLITLAFNKDLNPETLLKFVYDSNSDSVKDDFDHLLKLNPDSNGTRLSFSVS